MRDVKQKKPFYKRWWFIAICVFLAFGILGTIFESEESKQERATEEAAVEQKKVDDRNAKKEAKEKAAVEKKQKELAEKKAFDALPIDKKLQENDNHIDRAEFTEPGFLEVFYATQNALPDSIATEDVHDVFKDFKEAFSDSEVTGVKATIVNEGKNGEGEQAAENMIVFVYSRDSFEKLDYKKFIDESDGAEWKIYNNSDEYYLYPRIFRNMDEEFMDKLTSGVSKVPPVTD